MRINKGIMSKWSLRGGRAVVASVKSIAVRFEEI